MESYDRAHASLVRRTNDDEEILVLRAYEVRNARVETKKCRHTSFKLCKAAYKIDEYLDDSSTDRIPIRRKEILN